MKRKLLQDGTNDKLTKKIPLDKYISYCCYIFSVTINNSIFFYQKLIRKPVFLNAISCTELGRKRESLQLVRPIAGCTATNIQENLNITSFSRKRTPRFHTVDRTFALTSPSPLFFHPLLSMTSFVAPCCFTSRSLSPSLSLSLPLSSRGLLNFLSFPEEIRSIYSAVLWARLQPAWMWTRNKKYKEKQQRIESLARLYRGQINNRVFHVATTIWNRARNRSKTSCPNIHSAPIIQSICLLRLAMLYRRNIVLFLLKRLNWERRE